MATAFLEQLEKISSDSTAVMLAIFAVFALVHSGLAYLRPYGLYHTGTSVSSLGMLMVHIGSPPVSTCTCWCKAVLHLLGHSLLRTQSGCMCWVGRFQCKLATEQSHEAAYALQERI